MRLKKVLLLVVVFWSLNLIQSCREQHFLITDIPFQGAYINELGDEVTSNHYRCTDIFEDDIIFIISYETEFIAYSPVIESGNICYATTLPTVLDNEIVRSTFSLSFDDYFLYDGDTIEANTDIFQVESIVQEIEFSESNMVFCGAGADIVMDFSDEFVAKSQFNSEYYQVTFLCESSDSISFVKTADIQFNIE